MHYKNTALISQLLDSDESSGYLLAFALLKGKDFCSFDGKGDRKYHYTEEYGCIGITVYGHPGAPGGTRGWWLIWESEVAKYAIHTPG